jgi:tetratricopeptide (TPR) repeat protein
MPRHPICLLAVIGVLSLVLTGCGESKTPPAGEATAPSAEGEAAAAAAEEAPAPAPEGYAVPSALSAKEVKAQYGIKQMRKAKKSNTAGYKARKADDAAKAIEHYNKALELAPGYVTARFNLACEHARAKDADAAIGAIEHLFRMGTARKPS